jgi:hydrogenase-4 component B
VALGFAGGILHVFNHALFKCLLFYAAGAINRATHSVDLERLGGLLRRMPWTGALFLLGGLAISALPPWNGFVSEFLIYAGLLDQSASAGVPQVLFVFVAALLAFVGGVSALAMTRAFGIAFLGRPRDPGITCTGEARPLMLLPMVLHGLGIAVFGLVPALGLRLVREPLRLFANLLPARVDLAVPARTLAPLAATWGLLLLLVLALWGLRRWLARGAAARAHVTWGCGYPTPPARAQYTGASFAAPLTVLFAAVLPRRQRQSLPEETFPAGSGKLETHTVDAVEHRMFEVLGNSHDFIRRLATRISEEPRFAFGVGLLVLAALVGGLFAGGGR